jgi:hypothetical protein
LTVIFIPREQLGFALAEVIERTVDDWSEIRGSDLIEPESESRGLFIAAELNARRLRNAVEADGFRTAGDDYHRPLGE